MGGNIFGPEEVRERRKSKAISHTFGNCRYPETEDRGMPPEDVGGYIYKDSQILERTYEDFYDHSGYFGISLEYHNWVI